MVRHWFLTAALALALGPAANAAYALQGSFARETAVIVGTGSTNALGFRVSVRPSGAASYIIQGRHSPTDARVPRALAERLWRDLRNTAPIFDTQPLACMKSASFGTALLVQWRGRRSPDLMCARDARAAALLADIQAILQALHLDGARRRPVMRPMLPNEPRNVSAPVPVPSASAAEVTSP